MRDNEHLQIPPRSVEWAPKRPALSPSLIVGLYVAFASLWFFGSDPLARLLGLDEVGVRSVHVAKGGLFIIVSAILLYGLVRAALRRSRAYEAKLKESASSLLSVTALVPGVVMQCRRDAKGIWCCTYVSDAIESIYGLTPDQVENDPMAMLRIADPRDFERLRDVIQDSARTLAPNTMDLRIITPRGEHKWIRNQFVVTREPDGSTLWNKIAVDITVEMRLRALRDDQSAVLRRLMSDEPLESILDSISRMAESSIPGMMCSVMLVDEGGARLRVAAAPSLPREVIGAVDNLLIGPTNGCCGAAAFHGRTVVARDTLSDPLFREYRELARSHDLRACWSLPVASASGPVLGTLAMYYRQPREPSEAELALIGALAELVAVAVTQRRGEQTLRASEERYRSIVEDQTELICRFTPGGVLTFTNNTFCRFFFCEQPCDCHGRSIFDYLESGEPRSLSKTMRCLAPSSPVGVFEQRHAHRNGQARCIAWTCRAHFDGQGRVASYQAVGADISALKAAEELLLKTNHHQRLLLDELDHRVKNSLAGLLSLITLSEQESTDLEGLASSIRARVQTMSATHSLLSASHWTSVELDSLLQRLVPGECPGVFSAQGPPVRIAPRQVTALGMIIQELLTNSLKYGALGTETGRLAIKWTVQPGERGSLTLDLHWTERGGPPIATPVSPRLGLRLITGFARSELGGEASLKFEPDGASHHFLLRLDPESDSTQVAESADSANSASAASIVR